MGFEVLKKKSHRVYNSEPAVTIGLKGLCSLNKAFVEKYKLKVGDEARINVLYDADSGKFAVRMNAENPEFTVSVRRNRQIQLYLKTILYDLGIVVSRTCNATMEHDEDSDLWIFAIPEDAIKKRGAAKDAEGTKIVKKKKKKASSKRRLNKIPRA